ncbi:MAG: hypothetical protein ACI9HY_002248 [Planctomycetaceae bacterium]|jgi:hypothetical protein
MYRLLSKEIREDQELQLLIGRKTAEERIAGWCCYELFDHQFLSHLEGNLQAQLSLPIINVASVVQAMEALEATDFACIIEDASHVDYANDDLAQLLAITPLGTRIIALVSARTVPEPDYWVALGAIQSKAQALLE